MNRSAPICLAVLLCVCSAASAQTIRPASAPNKAAVVDAQTAMSFAREWVDAWNAHDLERILSHYTEDFEMASPLIVERMGEPSGVLKGKPAMRSYWGPALKMTPPLRFELLDVFAGVRSITMRYRSVGRRDVCEVVHFNERGQVVRASAHYIVDKSIPTAPPHK